MFGNGKSEKHPYAKIVLKKLIIFLFVNDFSSVPVVSICNMSLNFPIIPNLNAFNSNMMLHIKLILFVIWSN